MQLILTRSQCVDGATLGDLQAGTLALKTIELPWDDNECDKSCVPPGTYDLIPYLSPTHGLVYRLHNPQLMVYGTGLVPEGARSSIEIHIANFAPQLLGCIAVGLTSAPMLDVQTGQVFPAVQDSDTAMIQLRALLGSSGGNLLVIQTSQESDS